MNKKNRFVDTEQWRSNRKFTEMKGWAQLLHLYLYLDRADFAGIAHLDLVPANHYIKTRAFSEDEISHLPEEVRSQLMPDNMYAIATELIAFWDHCGDGIFICRDFIENTQHTKLLRLSTNPHARVIKDIAHWHAGGFLDIYREVMNANAGITIRPIHICLQELKDSVLQAKSKSESAQHGAVGRQKNFVDTLMHLFTISPTELLPKVDTDIIKDDLVEIGFIDAEAIDEKPALENKVEATKGNKSDENEEEEHLANF